jgi:adenine deaminase
VPHSRAMTVRLHPSPATLRRLAAVAQRREPADLVIGGGALVNVFTEEVQEGWGLAVADGRVAFVGPDIEVQARAGPDTAQIDLGGDLVAPGLIEGHTHLTRIRVSDYADAQVAAGVTTTIVECLEFAAVTGPAGIRELLAEAERVGGRFLYAISGLIVVDAEQDAAIRAEELVPLLDHPRVAALGEVYWADLLRGHRRSEELISAALDRGLPVAGHAAGARLPALNALAAWGIGTDHEATTSEDLLTRLRIGLHGEARHGATRQDLHALAGIWRDAGVDLGRVSFVTDGVEPEVLARGESLNAIVDLAQELGLSLPRAIRMASRGPAEAFGLSRWLGGLGPAMLADLVILPAGGRFRPRLVLVAGRRPSPSPPSRYPAWIHDMVKLDGLRPELLEPPGPGRWRAMEQVAPLVTREVESGGSDALVCACVDRLGGTRGFRGLLRGFGLRGGAVAASSGWESPGLLIAGDRPQDMAAAARRVADNRGGAAVFSEGKLLAEWVAPVGGLYSTGSPAEVVSQVSAVNGALASLGCPWPNGILSLEVLTTGAIPFLRIGPGGYRRLKDGALLGLDWGP